MQVQYVYHCCLFPTKLAFILTCGASANIAENVFRVSSGTIGELRTVWEHCAHGIEMKFAFLITSEEPALTRDIYDSGTLWTICIWTKRVLRTSPCAGGLGSTDARSGNTFSKYHLKFLQPSLFLSLIRSLMSPISIFFSSSVFLLQKNGIFLN